MPGKTRLCWFKNKFKCYLLKNIWGNICTAEQNTRPSLTYGLMCVLSHVIDTTFYWTTSLQDPSTLVHRAQHLPPAKATSLAQHQTLRCTAGRGRTNGHCLGLVTLILLMKYHFHSVKNILTVLFFLYIQVLWDCNMGYKLHTNYKSCLPSTAWGAATSYRIGRSVPVWACFVVLMNVFNLLLSCVFLVLLIHLIIHHRYPHQYHRTWPIWFSKLYIHWLLHIYFGFAMSRTMALLSLISSLSIGRTLLTCSTKFILMKFLFLTCNHMCYT